MIAQSLEEEQINESESKPHHNYYDYDYGYYSSGFIERDNIYLEPYKNYLISVIYRCESEISVIREQIVCLSHILSKELNIVKYRYEFICLIPPYMSHIYDKMLHLAHDFTAVRPFLIDNMTDLGQFMAGGLNSCGKIVVDARYLASEIDFILSFKNKSHYVKCIRPKNQINSRIPIFLPIIATKDAISTVFRQMHTTGIGSFYEFEFLCFNYKITFDIKAVNYTNIKHPILENFYSLIVQKIIMYMYLHRYWSIPFFNYTDSNI